MHILPQLFKIMRKTTSLLRGKINMYDSSIHNSPKLKTIQMSFKSEWPNYLWYIHPIQHCATIKTNYWCTWLGWTLKALCWVKEANLKRLHNIWLFYVTFWKRENHKDGEQVTSYQGLGVRGNVWLQRENTGDRCGWWNCLYPDCGGGAYMNVYMC